MLIGIALLMTFLGSLGAFFLKKSTRRLSGPACIVVQSLFVPWGCVLCSGRIAEHCAAAPDGIFRDLSHDGDHIYLDAGSFGAVFTGEDHAAQIAGRGAYCVWCVSADARIGNASTFGIDQDKRDVVGRFVKILLPHLLGFRFPQPCAVGIAHQR